MDKNNRETFMELCMAEKISIYDIDKFVESWHCNQKNSCSLCDYLGMTWEEYIKWVKSADSLTNILADRVKIKNK